MNQTPDKAKQLRRWIGYAVGAALLLASVVIAVRGADWSALADASVRQGVVLVAAAAVNLLLTGLIFTVMTRPFEKAGRRVGRVEMQALIAASTLLNYLPLRPGLVGRAAYLKRRFEIAYRHSALIILLVLALSTVVYGALLALTVFGGMDEPAAYRLRLGFVIVAPALVLMLAGALAAGRSLWSAYLSTFGNAWALRCLDAAAVAVRLIVALRIVGVEVSFAEAMVLATCGMFITLTGLTPNGLGLREWLYGLIASSGFFGGDVVAGLELALAAALLDRAAEVVVMVPAGLIGIAWLKPRFAGDSQAGPQRREGPDAG